jgi:hypothetical protein
MIAQNALVGQSETSSSARIFLYELAGLRQNPETEGNNFQIRLSGSTFVKVPANRMNEAMRRFNRIGATIVSIKPLEDSQEDSQGEGAEG